MRAALWQEAVRALVRRHLYAYGPATPRDLAKWPAARPGWTDRVFASRAAAGEIEEFPFEGTRAWGAHA